MDKVSMSYLFSFPIYQTKCVIKFLFRQLMISRIPLLRNHSLETVFYLGAQEKINESVVG